MNCPKPFVPGFDIAVLSDLSRDVEELEIGVGETIPHEPIRPVSGSVCEILVATCGASVTSNKSGFPIADEPAKSSLLNRSSLKIGLHSCLKGLRLPTWGVEDVEATKGTTLVAKGPGSVSGGLNTTLR